LAARRSRKDSSPNLSVRGIPYEELLSCLFCVFFLIVCSCSLIKKGYHLSGRELLT
jgi:hypothetical protein